MYIIDEPKLLFELDYWPCDANEHAENVNAVTRFVVLSSVMLFAYRKNYRILAGGVVLAAIVQIYGKRCETREAAPQPQPQPQPHPQAVAEPPIVELSAERDYYDSVNDFAHFAYGDINKNLKQN